MLERLRQLAVFAKAVETGSFRGAAKALTLSPSVVSHHISKLEAEMGVALLYRSTRKLSLTEDGEKLFVYARDMVAAAEHGLDEISAGSSEPSGRLRITAPAVLAHSGLIDRIAAFCSDHPKVDLDVGFSDMRRDIIGDGIDLAIRMGWLKDSSLKSRKIASEERVLVAAPSFLKGMAPPENPEDIRDGHLVHLGGVGRQFEFLNSAGDRSRIAVTPRIVVDDAVALYRLVVAGVGIGSLPRFLAADDLAKGRVVTLMPKWRLEPLGIYAVWPPNTPRGGLTSRFVKYLDPKTTSRIGQE